MIHTKRYESVQDSIRVCPFPSNSNSFLPNTLLSTMDEISSFERLLPITRHWFGFSVIVPLLTRFGLVSVYRLILTSDFLWRGHLWKPISCVLWYPIQ